MMYAPAMAGVARPITVTDEERAQLTAWTRQGTTEQRIAQRARIVLEAAAGQPTKEIASRWGLRLAASGSSRAKKRAVVAVARKLAVLLHRLWVTGEVYEPLRNEKETPARAG